MHVVHVTRNVKFSKHVDNNTHLHIDFFSLKKLILQIQTLLSWKWSDITVFCIDVSMRYAPCYKMITDMPHRSMGYWLLIMVQKLLMIPYDSINAISVRKVISGPHRNITNACHTLIYCSHNNSTGLLGQLLKTGQINQQRFLGRPRLSVQKPLHAKNIQNSDPFITLWCRVSLLVFVGHLL